ncbi:hypothetical protein [Thermofilum sp.]|jgi:hypothetical protein|uniref:hypothetical protein n=1 Tax=Thermofilum sp. TaxID=1961369 RepID=UPI00258E4A80|nr:hypothetical protein [Thermofilum sp.]
MIDQNKLRSILHEYYNNVAYTKRLDQDAVKVIGDVNDKIKQDVKENWSIYSKLPQLNPIVFSDALEVAERGLTGQATYTVSELNKALRGLNQLSMMLWGDRCARTIPSLEGLGESATEGGGEGEEEVQEETKTFFGTGGVGAVSVRKKLKKTGSSGEPASVAHYQMFLNQIGSCMSQLNMYLKTSRCKVEDKSDPNIVRACFAFDYAAKVLERKRLLKVSVDVDYDGAMRLLLKDMNDETEEGGFGGEYMSEVKPSLIIRDDYMPKDSVYPELKAIAEKDRLVIHLDADREAMIDYKNGTLVMKNASVNDTPVSRLFKGLGLDCEDSVNVDGEKLMVCRGVNQENIDKVAIGVATTANTHLRRYWGEYNWPEDALKRIADKISNKFSEQLKQLRK